MKRRTEGHTETTLSGDTRAVWSEAYELAPSLPIAYVWHASVFTREVLNGLLRMTGMTEAMREYIIRVIPKLIEWLKGVPPALVPVRMNGINAEILFEGLTPGAAGLYQINARVPDGVGSGDADVDLGSSDSRVKMPVQ